MSTLCITNSLKAIIIAYICKKYYSYVLYLFLLLQVEDHVLQFLHIMAQTHHAQSLKHSKLLFQRKLVRLPFFIQSNKLSLCKCKYSFTFLLAAQNFLINSYLRNFYFWFCIGKREAQLLRVIKLKNNES